MNKNTLTHTHTNHIIPQVKQKAAEKEGMHACCLQCNRVARKKKKFDPSCWNPCCFSFFFTFFFCSSFFFSSLLFFLLFTWFMADANVLEVIPFSALPSFFTFSYTRGEMTRTHGRIE